MNINVFKKQNKFLSFIKTFIVSLILGVMFTLCISLLFGYKYMIVASGSMLPTLKVPTLVAVAPKDFDEIKKGDIITWKSGSTYNTHRAYEILEGGKVRTKGDNNPGPDAGYVTKDNYVGTVVMHLDLLGKIIVYIKEHIFLLALVVIYIFLMYLLLN